MYIYTHILIKLFVKQQHNNTDIIMTKSFMIKSNHPGIVLYIYIYIYMNIKSSSFLKILCVFLFFYSCF